MSKNARNPAITYHDRVAHRYDDIYRGDYWEFYRAARKGLTPESLQFIKDIEKTCHIVC